MATNYSLGTLGNTNVGNLFKKTPWWGAWDNKDWGTLEENRNKLGWFGRDFYNPNWFNAPDFTDWYQNQGQQARNQNIGTAAQAYQNLRWQPQDRGMLAGGPARTVTGGNRVTPFGYVIPSNTPTDKWAWLKGATQSTPGNIPQIPAQGYQDVLGQLQGYQGGLQTDYEKALEAYNKAQGQQLNPEWTKWKQAEDTYAANVKRLEEKQMAEWEEAGGRGLPEISVPINKNGPEPIKYLAATAGAPVAVPPTAPTPVPPFAQAGIADVASTLSGLGNQYRNIANQGLYGEAGIRNILSPSEQAQDLILQRLEPFAQQMLGTFDTQTQAALQNVAAQAAEQRRRATQGMAPQLARLGVQQPGRALQEQAAAMSLYFSEQAQRAYQAQQQRLAQEQDLRTQAENAYRGIVQQRGMGRSQLLGENLQSKLQGLQGLQGTAALQADWLGNRPWDLQDPVQKQYAYQAGLAGLGQGFDLQRLYAQNDIWRQQAAYTQQLRKDFEQWLAANDLGQYADPSAMDRFVAALNATGEIVPG